MSRPDPSPCSLTIYRISRSGDMPTCALHVSLARHPQSHRAELCCIITPLSETVTKQSFIVTEAAVTSDVNPDVVVVGGGNAALSAALAAIEQGANVLVLEKAPEYLRGGNSYFTGGLFRFAYDGLEDLLPLLPDMSEDEKSGIDVGSYTESAFYEDIMRVTEGLSDAQLVQTLVSQSLPTMRWLGEQGVPWILA
ncbi:MAG: FAD-dependent oxidoreductase [Dehalococcoidia bacterium]|nr:FAD-dependent oxidoreductase [Dehalococcoidia bacterium]